MSQTEIVEPLPLKVLNSKAKDLMARARKKGIRILYGFNRKKELLIRVYHGNGVEEFPDNIGELFETIKTQPGIPPKSFEMLFFQGGSE